MPFEIFTVSEDLAGSDYRKYLMLCYTHESSTGDIIQEVWIIE
jgi:hypothetical protein